MKAIFLCEGAGKIFRVYDEKAVCQLTNLVEIEKKIYTKADVLDEPARFSDVEIIFST